MSTPNIVPVRAKVINESQSRGICDVNVRAFPTGSIVDNASDYEVCVEEIYAPVNSSNMLIDLNEKGYTVVLFCDVKTPPDPPIPGLVYGPNHFRITGEIHSVQQLLDKINEILAPFQLGSFSINSGELIEFKTILATAHEKIFMYLDNRLAKMFEMLYPPVESIGGSNYFQWGEKYKHQVDGFVEVQQKFTLNRFYKIRAIVIHTDLPTYFINSDNRSNDSYPSTLLYQVHYNSSSMSEVIDILVTPQNQLWRSLTTPSPIRNFNCRLTCQYESGSEIPVTLDEGENARITFCFSRIHKI